MQGKGPAQCHWLTYFFAVSTFVLLVISTVSLTLLISKNGNTTSGVGDVAGPNGCPTAAATKVRGKNYPNTFFKYFPVVVPVG